MDLSRRALQTNGKLVFKFRIRFSNYWPKTEKYFRMNIEAWILMKVQCVIYRWIRLDKLY